MIIKSHIPKIRFKEFSWEWEEKKLWDVSTFLNSKRIPLTEWTREKWIYPYYWASWIIDYVKDYIFDWEYILLWEDWANIITRSTRLVFLAKWKFWVNNHAHVFQAKWDNYFLCEVLERINYEQYNTWTAQPKLNNEVLKNVKFNLPQLPEQQKIASFLSSVDEKIEKIKEKKKNLEEYKKGIMQKIFSQEIRFKDENWEEFGEWEEKKLGEVWKFISWTGFSDKEQWWKIGIPFYKVSDMNLIWNEKEMIVSNNYVSEIQITTNKYKVIKDKSIIFAKVWAAIFLERKRLAENFLIDNNMMAYKSTIIDIKFLLQLFSRIRLSKFAQVWALPSYNWSDLAVIKTKLPFKKEQEKIADFLSGIDEKLEKVSHELGKMEEFKKGLLQGMFV